MNARYIEKGGETSRWEVGVKNKWRWGWIEETGADGKPQGSWCQKLKETGACFCVPCSRKLMYGSSGKKILNRHASDPGHIASMRALSHTSNLPGATATVTTATSMTDRVCEQKIRVTAFIAEHDLSFTMARPLVELCKKLAEDKNALAKLSISNNHASYLNTHGLAPEFKRQLAEKLKKATFSINVDKATHLKTDKVLNVLVRFIDDNLGKVATQHLASRKVNISNSSAVMQELKDIMDRNGLDWSLVISMLFDNCNVMRGKKTGVEARARKENPNLLDIACKHASETKQSNCHID